MMRVVDLEENIHNWAGDPLLLLPPLVGDSHNPSWRVSEVAVVAEMAMSTHRMAGVPLPLPPQELDSRTWGAVA